MISLERLKHEEKRYLNKMARIELARRDLFAYANLIAPKFYTPDKKHLVELCNRLQNFVESPQSEVMVVNIPPRHGKSRTLGKLVEWILGHDSESKVMTGTYNETLSTTFSKSVRNTILEEKADENIVVYSDIFSSKIKQGDASMNMWSLVGGHNNYLATSPSGTATGFGANYLILDDLVKSEYEARLKRKHEENWEWFVGTMLQRLEEGGKIIACGTRWHSDDIFGRILKELPKMGFDVESLLMEAADKEGNLLCPTIMSRKSYEQKKASMPRDIFLANYHQRTIDMEGKLYTHLKTYEDKPEFVRVCAYIDTADTGADYLAGFVYGETADNEAYVLDIIYTDEHMDITEPLVASKLHEYNVNVAWIESNNGGRGFARNVGRILEEQLNSNKATINWFHQSKNKVSRIISAASWCMEHVYFPVLWMNRFPRAYEHLTSYQRKGKNDHDDIEDALTGISEKIGADTVTLNTYRHSF